MKTEKDFRFRSGIRVRQTSTGRMGVVVNAEKGECLTYGVIFDDGQYSVLVDSDTEGQGFPASGSKKITVCRLKNGRYVKDFECGCCNDFTVVETDDITEAEDFSVHSGSFISRFKPDGAKLITGTLTFQEDK